MTAQQNQIRLALAKKTILSASILLSLYGCESLKNSWQDDPGSISVLKEQKQQERAATEETQKRMAQSKQKPQSAERYAYRSSPSRSSYEFYELLPAQASTNELEQSNTYRSETESSIKSTLQEPLSTFSVDVDTASFLRASSYLDRGLLPPESSIRSEEFINALQYDYERPSTINDPLSIVTQVGPTPWNENTSLLQVAISAHELDPMSRLPANLVLLLDVSGSMNSPQKLPLLKRSLTAAFASLDEQDTISIVTYSGKNQVLLEGIKGDQEQLIMSVIEQIEAKGSTNIGDGMREAYRLAHKYATSDSNNRILMFTDGDLNVGMEEDELVSFAKKQKALNIDLTILGMGSYGYNDAALENLSNQADGQYHFIGNYHDAIETLSNSFMGSIYNVAEDVKIQIEFNPQYIAEYRLIGYENRHLTSDEFNNDNKDAGDLGSGQSVTALYEVVWSESDFRFTDTLKYSKGAKQGEFNDEIATVKLRFKLPTETESLLKTSAIKKDETNQTSEQFYRAVSAAALAQLMSGSQNINNFCSIELKHWIEKHNPTLPKRFLEMLDAYVSLTSSIVKHG